LNRTYDVAAWRVGERTQRRVMVRFNDISERKSNHA